MTSIQTVCNYVNFMRLMRGAVRGTEEKCFPEIVIHGQRPDSFGALGSSMFIVLIDLFVFYS